MKPLLIALPGNLPFAELLAAATGYEIGAPEIHRFPDEETYLRLDMDLHGRSIALVATLDRPDPKLLPLLLAARTVHELGAASVGLIAPYLPYMRQDRRFHRGEALSASAFAAIVSPHFDWLVTVDPHLHRIHSLAAVYPIPHRVVHAAPFVANWIATHVKHPLLVGPDSESVQWVSDAARTVDMPVVTLKKTRTGDSAVSIETIDFSPWLDRTPVLVDDIISTGHTMTETVRLLSDAGMPRPVCIGVHGIFASGAYDALCAAGPCEVVTTNTVSHISNAIDVSGAVAAAMLEVTR